MQQGEETMSSNVIRLGMVAGLAILLAGAIALAQDRGGAQPATKGPVDVFNSIQGRMVIITSRPNGALVEEGDIVCELDPRALKDRLTSQEIVVRAAEFDFESATMAREATHMRIVEYVEGQFRNELATIGGETKVAEANLSRAEDQLDWARRMFEKGYVSMAEKVTNELLLKEARFGLEVSQSKRKVLLDFTKERTLRELRSEAAAAMSRELAKQAALERERSAQKSLTDQIGRCKIAAPIGGRVEYAAPIGAGAVVHDGQLLFRVVPGGTANTKAK
jgi:HlyD family secretion protein